MNSSISSGVQSDSIVKRTWTFGDGYTLTDNQVNPAHEYKDFGNYNVCLTIKTAKGCESTSCTNIRVNDSTNQDNSDNIKIIELYPNPVSTQLNAVIYSRNNNVSATIEVHDIYGNLKLPFSSIFLQENNTVTVSVLPLVSGPYVLKVRTADGNPGRSFFKL